MVPAERQDRSQRPQSQPRPSPHSLFLRPPQAFFFKDRLGLGHNERLVAMMGTWTEGLVGVSLIAIGLLGLKESLLDYEEVPAYEAKSAGSAVVDAGGGAVAKSGAGGGGKAIFLNGVLHGFSWDGAPSLAPALALSSWGSVLWFLLAYCSGTMVRVDLLAPTATRFRFFNSWLFAVLICWVPGCRLPLVCGCKCSADRVGATDTNSRDGCSLLE